MQSLWSRAAGQAHLCGCRTCHQVASTMTRPSATRAVRRKVTFGEVFTAFYTSIMGTAAVVDAKFKDDRRKDLDRQIEEVKADLERLSRTAQWVVPDPSALPPSGDIQNRYKGCWRQDHRQQRGRGVAEFFDSLGDVSTWNRTLPRSAELDAWWKSSGLPEAEAGMSTKKWETDYDALQQQVRLEEQDASIAHRQPKTGWQLYRRVRDTHGIVTQLLQAVDLHPMTNRRELHLLMRNIARSGFVSPYKQQRLNDWYENLESEEPDPLRQSVRRMYAEYFPRYKVADLDADPRSIAQVNSELNESIRAIFANDPPTGSTSSQDDIRERVVKTCHNLLVGPLPPTVNTFSTIMLCLDRIGQHEAANKVLVYLLYISRLEPTQGTLITLFNHYKVTGNVERFSGLMQRCTALHPKNIRIRSKSLRAIAANTQLQMWARIKDVTYKENGMVKERVWFSNSLINTIIDGLLWHDCLDQAARVVTFCWSRGIRVVLQSMLQLMDQCVDALNEEAALDVLNAFFRNPHKIWPNLADNERGEFQVKLQRLMDFCDMDASAAELLARNRGSLIRRQDLADRRTRRRAYRVLRIKRRTEVAQGVIEEAQAAIEAFEALEEGVPLDTTTEDLSQTPTESVSQSTSSAHLPNRTRTRTRTRTWTKNEEDEKDTIPAFGRMPLTDITCQQGPRSPPVHESGLEGASQSASREQLSSAYGP